MHPWPAASSLRGRGVSIPEEALREQSPWGPYQPPDLSSPAPQPLGPVARMGLWCTLGKSAPSPPGGPGVGNSTPYQGEEPSIPLRTTRVRRMVVVLVFVFCVSPSLSAYLSVCFLTAGGTFRSGEQG